MALTLKQRNQLPPGRERLLADIEYYEEKVAEAQAAQTGAHVYGYKRALNREKYAQGKVNFLKMIYDVQYGNQDRAVA